jgi:hypothetical protein
MVVVPSKCTVLIQNILLVDWLGVTLTTVFAAVVVVLLLTVCANTLWEVWICIPTIIAAVDTITTATVAVEIMIDGLVFFRHSINMYKVLVVISIGVPSG